jgi:SAM-dependent methyltransferase
MTNLGETQKFFGARADGWEDRFPDDEAAFARAIGEMELRQGMAVLDLGCGTGRALPLMRAAVSDTGRVVGLDATPEMLAAARRRGRDRFASLVLGDAEALPFADGAFDAVFAAGLVPHLADPRGGLAEIARVTRPHGKLAVFHPIGRATLAARHGGTPSDDEVTAPRRLADLLAATGWTPISIDDGADRFLALAVRA